MISRLENLDKNAQIAVDAVLAEMKLLWPEGAKLKAKLQTNHNTPSNCTVLFHPIAARGFMRVRLDGGHETTIHYSSVVE